MQPLTQLGKDYTYILRRPHKFETTLHFYYLTIVVSKKSGILLWPSQNIWTLSNLRWSTVGQCHSRHNPSSGIFRFGIGDINCTRIFCISESDPWFTLTRFSTIIWTSCTKDCWICQRSCFLNQMRFFSWIIYFRIYCNIFWYQ